MTRLFTALLAFLLAASPALAGGAPVTLYDGAGVPLGTPNNALYVTGGTGGSSNSGGTAAAATTSNGTDGQATSSTNQQSVVFPYVFNGSTWDRARGTNGFLGTFLSAPLPAGTNAIGAVTQSGTWSVGTTNGALENGGNLASLLARTPPLGATTRANSRSVTIATDQPAITVSPNACTTTQTVVSGTGGTLIAANASRKSLRIMNIGAAVVTVAPGTTAPTVGQGMIYEPNGSGAGHQGGSEAINDPAIATNAFAYASSATATIAVWECQ